MGDIHAKIAKLSFFLEGHQGEALILMGDCGFGFDPLFPQILDHLAATNRVHLFCIRGNHDDPQFFKGGYETEFLHPLPDYSELMINGKRALAIGGGISIDRTYRKEGRNWWRDEVMTLDREKIGRVDAPIDLLLTHSGPAPAGLPSLSKSFPGLVRRDKGLLPEIHAEQDACKELEALLEPAYWVFAHFHVSHEWKDGKTTYRVLDVNEAMDLRDLTSQAG